MLTVEFACMRHIFLNKRTFKYAFYIVSIKYCVSDSDTNKRETILRHITCWQHKQGMGGGSFALLTIFWTYLYLFINLFLTEFSLVITKKNHIVQQLYTMIDLNAHFTEGVLKVFMVLFLTVRQLLCCEGFKPPPNSINTPWSKYTIQLHRILWPPIC